MQNTINIWGVSAIIGITILLIGGVALLPKSPAGGGDAVAAGLHWHPELQIFVDGEKQQIPANIGLGGGGHQPIHTHTEDVGQGVLHFEFGGVAYTGDLRLGNFFRIWGNKDIQTAFGVLEQMIVNGEESSEFGEYVVQSEDKIELHYKTLLQGEVM
ncbi:MAG: hypothetical protein ACJKSS_02005 [Patescibacteria group bacterium UBA2103]